MTKPDFMMQTFIRCSQDALWQALTDPDQMAAYHFMADKVVKEGDTFITSMPDGAPLFRARALKITPQTRIEATWEPQWEGGGAPSKTVFLIDAEKDCCRLTVEHYDLTFPVVPGEGVSDGWARWAASLKSWLETGKPMKMGMPPAP